MTVKSRRAEHAEDTRAALVLVARELFAERGYAETPTEEIVGRARVTRGALYHHFGSKEGLFRAVLQQEDSELIQRLVDLVETDQLGSGVDPWDQIRLGCQAYLDACLDPVFQRIALIDAPAVLGQQAWMQVADSEGRHGLSLLQERLRMAMDEGLIDRMPEEALAYLLGAAIREGSMLAARSHEPAIARSEIGVIVDRLLQGLRKGEVQD